MPDIKKKESIKSVKEFVGSSVRDKAAAAGIKAKDTVENQMQKTASLPQNGKEAETPENYAADSIVDNGKTIIEETVTVSTDELHKIERKAIDEFKKKRSETKQSDLPKDNTAEASVEQKTENSTAKTEDNQVGNVKTQKQADTKKADLTDSIPDEKKKDGVLIKPSEKGNQKQLSINQTNGELSVSEEPQRTVKGKTRSQVKAYSKSDIKRNVQTEKTVKTIVEKDREIKTTEKSAEIGKRTIKRASKSAKKAQETRAAAESMRKTAVVNKKIAQESAKTAKWVAEKTAIAIKEFTKAIAKGAKALAAAIKELAAVLAEASPVVIIIILVILAAGIAGTFLGIFLTNDETTGTQYTMTQAVSQLTSDYYENINAIGNNQTYDTMEINGNVAINWKDVLSIYAVKYTNLSDGFAVATLDDEKLEALQEIMEDMNPCVGVVTTKVVPVITVETDDDGNEKTVTKYESQKVLTVTSTHISAENQARLYHFSDDETNQLTELTSDKYDDLWDELVGATGDVIATNSTHIPKGIFTWPLQEDNSITSSYGYRYDPITGVYKFHSGLDIAAGYGTPILAAADGEVVIAGYMANGYGNYVKIKHNDTYSTLYGHCSALLVSVGQTVKQGQVIAQVGATGYATGNHVHFEVYMLGTRVNPMDFFG